MPRRNVATATSSHAAARKPKHTKPSTSDSATPIRLVRVVESAGVAGVFSFLLRMSRSRTVAEDLLDETWLRLVRSAKSLRPDTRIEPWLFTVARNLYWSYRRSSLVAETSAPELLTLWPSPTPWPSPFDLAAAGELERRVEIALGTLSPHHREALLLVAHEGLTPGEAAVACGVSAEAFRQRLSRARVALMEQLEKTPGFVLQRRYGT